MKEAVTMALALAAAILVSGAAAQQALLWVPVPGADAVPVIEALEGGKGRLTAAFTGLPKGLEARVRALEEAGRLELAIRPAGDPPLPLLYYPASEQVSWEGKPSTAAPAGDQYFLSLRLSLARDAAIKSFRKVPAGLVAPPGGVVKDYFPLARALGLKWVAGGAALSTAPADGGGVLSVPFTAFSSDSARAGFVVFDETSAADPDRLRAMLTTALKDPAAPETLTVSDALKLAASTAPAADSPPWSGDYTPWASSPQQAGALSALRQTRAQLMLHLNSLQGDYTRAAPAFGEYFDAEGGAHLRALASPDAAVAAEAEAAIRTSLADAYRLMQKPPPSWAFSGLADAADDTPPEEKLSVKMLPGGFLILNASRPASPPAHTPGLPDSSDPAAVWKLESLRADYGPGGTTFRFKTGALDNSLKNASGFSHVRLDLYMDVNHRPRAGISRTLEGRPYRLYPENAWEYALEVTPAGATLYRITPSGKAPAGRFPARVEDGQITVRLPASALRGSPGLWSYAALVLAPSGAGFSVTDYLAEQIDRGYIYAVRPGRR